MKTLFTFSFLKKSSTENGSGMDRDWTCNGPASDLGMTQPRFDSVSLSCRVRVLAILVACLTLCVGNAWGTTKNGDLFERMSSVDDIVADAEVIFVNQAETYACGTTQNTNNRACVAITTSNNQYIYSSSNNAQVFVVKTKLVGDATHYGFHTGSGYIYSASSSENKLKTNTTAASTAPNGTSAWSLAVSSSVFTAQNRGNTSYYLAFNGTTYFSQYKTGQSKPFIYKKVMSAPTVVAASSITSNGATITITDATNVKYYELYYSTSSDAPTASSTATTTITNAKTKTLTGLNPSTRYYLWARAYSTSPARKTGWIALTENSFTTLAASCSADPSVGNASLNGSFSLASIPLQASVSDDGGTGCTISDAGFVWQSGGSDPTISNNKTAGTYNAGIITGTITGSFSTGVTYKIKAYATNGHGDGLSSSSFTLIPRSVTFNLNGHGSSTPSVQYVNNGGLATDPSYSESVTGYAFGGWYDNSDWTQGTQWNFGSSTVSGGNVTLYAKWTPNNYTINLDKDLTPTSAGTASIAVTFDDDNNLDGTPAITPPTKTGWTFAGYYTAKNGGGTQIIDASGNVIASAGGGNTYTDASKNWKYADDITLYAKWTCTVTWSVSGATNVYSAQTLTYNASSTKIASVPDGEDLDLENDYCGDKFVGWTTTNIGSTGLDKDDDASEIAVLNLFTDVAGSPELKTVGNTTFYAVFADYDE